MRKILCPLAVAGLMSVALLSGCGRKDEEERPEFNETNEIDEPAPPPADVPAANEARPPRNVTEAPPAPPPPPAVSEEDQMMDDADATGLTSRLPDGPEGGGSAQGAAAPGEQPPPAPPARTGAADGETRPPRP